jgi:hypothetical protein
MMSVGALAHTCIYRAPEPLRQSRAKLYKLEGMKVGMAERVHLGWLAGGGGLEARY